MMINILRISGSYADEFDVSGIMEISTEEAKFLVDTQGSCFEEDREIYFGTNEYVELNELSITLDVVSEEDLVATKRVLGVSENSLLSYGLIDVGDIIYEAMNYEKSKVS